MEHTCTLALAMLKTHYIFRYDENFQLLGSSRYEQGQPPQQQRHSARGTEFQGFGIAEQQGLRDFCRRWDAG